MFLPNQGFQFCFLLLQHTKKCSCCNTVFLPVNDLREDEGDTILHAKTLNGFPPLTCHLSLAPKFPFRQTVV